MPRSKPWLKMWVEWVHDPKMNKLSLAEQGAWWRLLTLAQECHGSGLLQTGGGTPLTIEDMASSLHLTSNGDINILKSMVAKMENEGSLTWNSHTLNIVHFAERQEMAASETPEAVRERVKHYRERHAVTENSLHEEGSPISDINERLSQLPQYVDRLAEHEAIKQLLADIGKSSGFDVKSEYPIGPPIGPYGPRRIDLCWLQNGEIMGAFEIDYRTPRDKSLEKLQLTSCSNIYIILREPYIHLVQVKRRVPEEKDIQEESIYKKRREESVTPLRNGEKLVTKKGTIESDVTELPLHTAKGNEKSVTQKVRGFELEIPKWVNRDTWEAYLEMRKVKKASPTQKAVELIIKKLDTLRESGQDVTEILNQSIVNNWTGVFPLRKEDKSYERKGQQRRDDAAAGDSSEILRRKGWRVNVSEPEPAADQD